MRRMFVVSLLVSLGMSGCGQLINVGDCERRCEMQNAEGCAAFAMDCEVLCDFAANQASTSGCGVEFNETQRCLLDNGVCDPMSLCGESFEAYSTCFSEFCDAEPESDVCPTRP